MNNAIPAESLTFAKKHLMLRLFTLLGLFLFLHSCAEWSSCESFNIDSFEIRTGLDIPKVTSVECFSDKQVRISLFDLDYTNEAFLKSYQTSEGYIQRFQFSKTDHSILETLQGKTLAETQLLNLTANQEYYVREGKNKDKSWKTVLVKDKGILIAEMQL